MPREMKGAAPQRGPWWIAALALALMMLGGLFAASPAPITHAEPIAITEGYVDWGFKESWRNYIGEAGTTLSEGATWSPEGVYRFPIGSGSYDDATKTTTLELDGRAYFSKHDDLLHMEVWDLRVVISPDEQLVWGNVSSRTLTEPREIVDYGLTPIAQLDIPSVDPVIADGTTTWAAIPASLTAEAAPRFIGYYPVGQTLDPVTVVYEGPGGKPEAEVITPPGTPGVEIVGEPVFLGFNLSSAETRFSGLFYDAEHDLVHVATSGRPSVSAQPGPAVRAFTASTLTSVGTGAARFGWSNSPRAAFDPESSTVFVVTLPPDGTNTPAVTAMTWDPVAQTYTTEIVDTAVPTNLYVSPFSWDSAGQRLVVHARNTSEGVAFIRTWERDEGGWTRVDYPLMPPEGETYLWFGGTGTSLAAAPDGTFILARNNGGSPPAGSGVSGPTLRLTLGEGAVEFEELGGTEVTDPTVPLDRQVVGANGVKVGTDGTVLLTYGGWDPHMLMMLGPSGDTYAPLGTWQREAIGRLRGAVIDPSDGTAYVVDAQAGNLVVVRDGEIVLRQPIPGMIQLVEFLDVTLVDQGTLVVTTLASPRAAQLTKLRVFGSSPAIDTHPEDVTITLEGSATATIEFQASASGDPEADLQWQVRRGGAGVWQNIQGATSSVLSFEATAADNASQYRLRATNAAGRNVSNPATLTVASAPAVLVQPEDIRVEPGQDAAFLVMPGGSPTPEVTWQRLVGDTWTDLSPSDPAYHIDGGFFTVLAVTEADDGAQFRARLANSIGEVFSDAVTLTVTEDGGGGPGDATQTITTNIGETGSLSISVEGTQVSLPSPALNGAGDALESSGAINNVTVTDLRSSDPGWNVSGQVSDFTSSSSSFAGSSLGWTPELVSQGASQNVVVGAPVLPGGSLGTGAPLGTAGAGEGRGTAVLGAQLELSIPVTTEPGVYEATLTLTVI